MSPDLELVVLVLGSLVEGPVIAEAPHVVDTVEALDAVGHSVHLQNTEVLRYRCHRVDLQVCRTAESGNQPLRLPHAQWVKEDQITMDPHSEINHLLYITFFVAPMK